MRARRYGSNQAAATPRTVTIVPAATAASGPRRAGYGEHPDQHEDERDRRAEVRLGEQEDTEDPDQKADRARELLERLRRAPSREEPGSPDGQRELGELGGLEDDRAEREPAFRAVHGGAEHEDGTHRARLGSTSIGASFFSERKLMREKTNSRTRPKAA